MKNLFIKTFSDKKYADDLLFNGAMFFRSALQFAQMENDSRADETEGQETYMINTEYFDNNGEFKLRVHDPRKKILGGTFQFVGTVKNTRPSEHDKLVIDKPNDCLIYSITYLEDNVAFDDLDVNKFGEHMIIIKDIEEFKNRIFNCFTANNIKYFSGPVKYYIEKAHNLHTLFRKHIRYKGEHEFRFIIDSPQTDTMLLKIGDISDIASYISSNKLFEYLSHYSEDSSKSNL